jgi:ferredoxin--NADP+ reductase
MIETVMRLEDYKTGMRYQATVVSNERITSKQSDEEVRELVLDVERADFPFRVGQSIGVIAPGSPEFGQKHHFRLYSVADLPDVESGKPRIKICVRRCNYIDEYSGEEYKGIASNYLCDRRTGDTLTMTGPFGLAFEVPEELDANLILIGTGTGIAPFRAFVKHLYGSVPEWKGRVWLFYGAKSGLELLYMNDEKNDFAQYYDRQTFEAFQALSPRPNWADPIAWDQAIAERGEELWKMLSDAKTYVYVAGLEKMRDELDAVFATLAGSKKKWQLRKAELIAGQRWVRGTLSDPIRPMPPFASDSSGT